MQELAEKLWTIGTERVAAPEETLARARELFGPAGITRLADLTQLDKIGIPVYQAVRPNATSLSVAQGKGVTRTLAQVSAAMESLEFWHAENIEVSIQRLRVAEAADRLDYDPYQLALSSPSWLNDETMLAWVEARSLVTGSSTSLPRELMDIGGAVRDTLHLPLFRTSTNGLASGNILSEALLHALFEIIERDSLERHRLTSFASSPLIALDSIDDDICAGLLDAFANARVDVAVYEITSQTGIPTFAAAITSADIPTVHVGSGCHSNRAVALSRALTESAQVRLTAVAGARDDLTPQYRWASSMPSTPRLSEHGPSRKSFADVHSCDWGLIFEENLRALAKRVHEVTGTEPMFVDLSKPELGLPVVFVAAPGLSPHRAE